jgi:flavin-dependent dehydrogenase
MTEAEGRPLAGTIDAKGAASRRWDVIVVGAGPAGAMTAREAARAGLSTLLVERQRFPRTKVCGGCLNRTAVESLVRAGLGEELSRCGGQRVDRIRLRHRGIVSRIDVPGGLALTRWTLDRMLARAAIESGAHFLPETSAQILQDSPGVLSDGRLVSLRSRDGNEAVASAAVGVVADGLGHTSLRACAGFESLVGRRSKIGAGAVTTADLLPLARGEVSMVVGSSGYVGVVLAEAGRAAIAAALDPALVKRHGSIERSVAAVFDEAGLDAPAGVDALDWQGTVPLTQRVERPIARRLVVIGDAAAYVEPFTGEGMAWAIANAIAVVPFLARGVAGWDDVIESEWLSAYRSSVGRQQRACGRLARALRSQRLVGAGMRLIGRWPGLARPIVARLGA